MNRLSEGQVSAFSSMRDQKRSVVLILPFSLRRHTPGDLSNQDSSACPRRNKDTMSASDSTGLKVSGHVD